jgi:hypothetical protein
VHEDPLTRTYVRITAGRDPWRWLYSAPGTVAFDGATQSLCGME